VNIDIRPYYESRKSCPTTCAARLGAFIGGDLLKDKGVKAQYVITRKPDGAPTSVGRCRLTPG